MKNIILLAVFLITSLGFSQNIDENKLKELANTISVNGCNCVKQVQSSNGDWVDSVQSCFVESFKKNELKVKQVLGENYLDEENAQNILQIINFAEAYWIDVCLDKLKSDSIFTLNLLHYFNENANLTYDLTSFIYKDSEGNTEVEEEIVEDPTFEVKGVVVKLYFDELETQYLVVKIDNKEVHFMAYNEFDNYQPYFKEKKLKVNDKVAIKYSVLNLFDDDKNDYVDEKRILNIEKI
ncbi:hypothetical protein G6N05_04345 [Flavobacterium sp. F372]|uniref:Uncharacterized protein n=1 Tax=Flavobacterium bernardetii TaxID=2813823 RepID=A0ABR7IWE5_9FLAO|nr:hypothetical protein [Flavobacterium bernardetii]MBC5834106.1 hypothetical protein [Flavobacterium bernardetii]NHF69338.1 hypothetical protein [Flavobacterium bernardetii]